jgi:hypothetical protein
MKQDEHLSEIVKSIEIILYLHLLQVRRNNNWLSGFSYIIHLSNH